jgi:hypothetical protein
METPGDSFWWCADQFALVAVTTETELGVATPWMVSGAAGGGGVFPEGGVTDEPPPPPHAATRLNSAAQAAK